MALGANVTIPSELLFDLMEALGRERGFPEDIGGLFAEACRRIRTADVWKCIDCGFETPDEALFREHMHGKLADLIDDLNQHKQIISNLAELTKAHRSLQVLNVDAVKAVSPALLKALDHLHTVAEELQSLARRAAKEGADLNVCPGCKKAYDAPVEGCILCRDRRAEIRRATRENLAFEVESDDDESRQLREWQAPEGGREQ